MLTFRLRAKVRSYTRDVVRAFARQGTPADMIQIGNEVTSGMLWPLGQIYQPDGQHWAQFAALVAAGLAGAQEGNPHGHQLRSMIHIDRGGDNGGTRWFLDHLLAEGADFDVLGQSYYAMWHGSLAALAANLNDTATRYGKDIVIAETQYPWTLANGDDLGNFVTDAAQLPDGHGAGFLVWEPEWIAGVGWEPGAGNPNDNLTLFDGSGRALPALAALRPPRR